MAVIGTVHEDITTEVLGSIGRWQWQVTFLATCLMLPGFFNYHADMFLVDDKFEHVCSAPLHSAHARTDLCYVSNGTRIFRCTEWYMMFLGHIKLKRRWLIFCDDEVQLFFMAIVSRLGLAFGSVIFGVIADSFGRKRSLAASLAAELPLRLLIPFCDSPGWLRLLVFLQAMLGGAGLFVGLLLVCEIASNAWRSRLAGLVLLPRLLALLLGIPLVRVMPNIETFSFVACLLNLALFVVVRYLPESPQWLLFSRRTPAAERLLLAAAPRNNVTLCSDFKIRPINHNVRLHAGLCHHREQHDVRGGDDEREHPHGGGGGGGLLDAAQLPLGAAVPGRVRRRGRARRVRRVGRRRRLRRARQRPLLRAPAPAAQARARAQRHARGSLHQRHCLSQGVKGLADDVRERAGAELCGRVARGDVQHHAAAVPAGRARHAVRLLLRARPARHDARLRGVLVRPAARRGPPRARARAAHGRAAGARPAAARGRQPGVAGPSPRYGLFLRVSPTFCLLHF